MLLVEKKVTFVGGVRMKTGKYGRERDLALSFRASCEGEMGQNLPVSLKYLESTFYSLNWARLD